MSAIDIIVGEDRETRSTRDELLRKLERKSNRERERKGEFSRTRERKGERGKIRKTKGRNQGSSCRRQRSG